MKAFTPQQCPTVYIRNHDGLRQSICQRSMNVWWQTVGGQDDSGRKPDLIRGISE
jgi:hypothetical protein